MDPRRARDPRLARVDPRLQARSHSNSPVPQPAYHGPMLQPNAAHGGPSHVGISYSNQQVMPQAQSTAGPSIQNAVSQPTPLQQAQGRPQSSKTYKTRPLFCVVCASNQVGFSWLSCMNRVVNSLKARASCRIVLWRDTTFSCECLFRLRCIDSH